MHVEISYCKSFLRISLYFIPLVSHSWNHDSFVLLYQDNMEISQASVTLPSQFWMFLCQGQLLISPRLWDWEQSHQRSPTWPGSCTQWHASVTDGACRERDALIGCSTQAWCKLSHKVQFVCSNPLSPDVNGKQHTVAYFFLYVLFWFFLAHKWWFRGYR